MLKNIQNKIYPSILLSLLLLLVNISSLMGATAKEDVKVEISYDSETKSILLIVINKGSFPIEIYNPDLKTKDPVHQPATLEVRLKDKNNEIMGKNVIGVDEDGFMSSEMFDSRLFKLPLPTVTMEAKEAFQIKTSLDKLTWGYVIHNHIPDIPDNIGYIQLRYGVILDPNAESIVTFTTEWLPY